ncbi:hypothetical protein BGX21_003912 [Mortierella sp. AD011]|nr:hypothetical protein BGX20_005757 [Mortierella sp. AD010]KAF9404024.1 hypothetical protein BGX21_003912 [Mortierella sp. AD011]
MKFFAAFVALVAAAVANAQVPYTDCAPGSDLTIDTFTLSPYPFCVGQNVCATGTGSLSVPVTAPSTLTIIGTYFGVTVYSDSHDVCALMAAQGYPCPVPTSLTSLTMCIMVLPTAPAGIAVDLTVSATNGNGNTLFCQTGTVMAATCP